MVLLRPTRQTQLQQQLSRVQGSQSPVHQVTQCCHGGWEALTQHEEQQLVQ
jgi:hypothetical protein